MDFTPALTEVTLLRRYKRFLADIRHLDGREETVHCPNPGAMLGVAPPGARAWVSRSPSKTRKLPLTLEVVECDGPEGPALVGVNTNHPNRLAEEAILSGLLPTLPAYLPLRREVRYGAEKSRIDLLLGPEDARIWVEVKNCHLLRREDGITEFPDCVTARGLKHLRELTGQAAAGDRAVLLFIVQREDATALAPAADLDPAYAEGLKEAATAGVEMLAMDCTVAPTGIHPRTSLEVLLQAP